MRIWSVHEVTRYIKAVIEADMELADLWIEGEVSNFHRASSGHCYFTLKDSESEIRCVMWRHQANWRSWLPEQGDRIEAHGHVSVYERGGAYQFYVDALERGGIGALWQAFQRLKDRLAQEGLFDQDRKRPLPQWPRKIGVVTSPTGAALQDILDVLQLRYPLVEVILSPSLVQGEEAPAQLVEALERVDALDDVDEIILARGGGSLEDLWAFNEESVARAICRCHKPVISGIGHETDQTIADFVADYRAPTPSAAAAAAVPDGRELRRRLSEQKRALTLHVEEAIRRRRELLEREGRALRARDPRRELAEYRQRVDELTRRGISAVTHDIALRREGLSGRQDRLRALNPRLVLERGYAIVEDRPSRRVVSDLAQAFAGQELVVNLHDGKFGARATDVPLDEDQ